MAILDDRSELADSTFAYTGPPGRALLTDVIDLAGPTISPNGSRPAGVGSFLTILVDQQFTSGGAATVAFELVSDAQSAIATDGSATLHVSSGPIPVAQLTAGKVALSIALPEAPLAERFLGVIQNTSSAALTGGKVSIWITDQPVASGRVYADNVA